MKTTSIIHRFTTICAFVCAIFLGATLPAQDAVTGGAKSLTPEQRAALFERAEEARKYLENLLKEAQARVAEMLAARPPKPYDPEAAKAAADTRKMARKRALAPWLFDADGKPTAEGQVFLENKAGREQALKAALSPETRPKLDFARTLSPRAALRNTAPESVGGGSIALQSSGNGRLELIDWLYDAQSDRTFFRLWLFDGPINEFWEIYRAPVLQSSEWVLARVGPPDAASGNIQQFDVAVAGQPSQAFFQIFLNQDTDYDGITDGFEVVMVQTNPNDPDSNSTRDANGDGMPDYPGLGSNGIADGDEDYDGDGLTTTYELTIGVNPLTSQPSADADSDGLPDWLESLITAYTGDPAPAPQNDSDGDGLNNATEWALRLDPSWTFDAVLGNYATLPDDQRAVSHRNLVFQSPSGLVPGQSSIPADAYFDSSFANYYGTAAQLIVQKDTDAEGNPAPGTDTFKWAIAYQTPPNFIPAQNVPDPNPADGPVEDADILLAVTETLGNVWQSARVSENLNTLSEPTLAHLQHRSFSRIWIKFRTLQLMMVAESLPQGLLLRARAVLFEIHTQATILRKTTLVIGQKYPSTQALARMGRFVPVAGSICSVLSFTDDANELVAAYARYVLDVKRKCDDNNETALDLAVALAQFIDVAFPAPVNSAFLWPIWWNAFSNFDGYSTSC
jgi:hypothetical protein